jgi:hypothetical protein
MHGAVGTRSTTSSRLLDGREIEEHWLTSSADAEAVAAWRIFTFNWRLLACMIGVVAAVLIATEFYIEPLGYLLAFSLAALYWRLGLQNVRSTARRNLRIFFCLIAIAQMILAFAVMLPLTYLTVSINLPLQDTALLAWDRALGFDFRSYLDFIRSVPRLLSILAGSYNSFNVQMFAIVLILPLAGCYRRSGTAICACVIALIATTCLSALVPAIGVYGALGFEAPDFASIEPLGYYNTLRDVPLLRGGRLHGLDLPKLVGVLTFPSFHAASAVLNMWAFWPLPWVRWAVVPLNIAMIAATPVGGGHYFVDVVAGILTAAAAILAALSISGRLSAARSASGGMAAGL